MPEYTRDAREFIHGEEPDEQRDVSEAGWHGVYDVRPRFLSPFMIYVNEYASAYGERECFTGLRTFGLRKIYGRCFRFRKVSHSPAFVRRLVAESTSFPRVN